MPKRPSDAAGIKSEPKLYSEICAEGLRKGKWTDEEEKYAATIIFHFENNLLPLSEQRESTIRLYLGKKLHCDPMRISKKFAGNNSVGKHFFCKKLEDGIKQTAEALEKAKALREKMRLAFIESVEKEVEAASKRPKRIRIRNRKKKKLQEDQNLLWDGFSDDDLDDLQSLLDDNKAKDAREPLSENVCLTPRGSPEYVCELQHPQTPPSAPIQTVFQHDKFVLDCVPPACAPNIPVPQAIPVMNVNVPYGYTLVCGSQRQPWVCPPAMQSHNFAQVTSQGRQQTFDAHLDAMLSWEDDADNYDFLDAF
jgi:hypothetical protein